MTKFTVTEFRDEHQIIRRYKVKGFWSFSTVRASRYKSYNKEQTWKDPEIDWSIGGRDQGEESDDLVAAECFAAAILDAVETARKWRDEA